jgi:rod shape-determining protein MreC
MRNLLRLIYRYYYFLLFLLFEFVCFFLIIQYNSFQRSAFLNSSSSVTGFIYETFDDFTDYLHLKEENHRLANENAVLRNMLKKNHKYLGVRKWEIQDSVYQKKFIFRSGKIINNSINKQRNYITINKGKKQGIKKEMAVVTDDGIVGIIKEVSRNYSTVISILNLNVKISAKIKKNGYFGSVSWDGKDHRYVKLNEIPAHVDVQDGDTIVTSGFSSIFPNDIPVGEISSVNKDASSSFYDIKVKLFNDLNQLSYIYIIENETKDEIRDLEENSND